MDSLTHFHSRNVYFYIHYINILKVKALDMFKKNIGFTPLKQIVNEKIYWQDTGGKNQLTWIKVSSLLASSAQVYCKLFEPKGFSLLQCTFKTYHVKLPKLICIHVFRFCPNPSFAIWIPFYDVL